MNPWDLEASELMIWGLVLHLMADWLFQNDWMAQNKMNRRKRGIAMIISPWWDRHPAAYVHSGIHAVFLAVIFGWVAVPLAIAHFFIDLRFPVAWLSKLVRQTQPPTGGFGIGTEVRIWCDQVWHIVCIAIAALVVTF